MANHFYGESHEAHYEKDLKDFTPIDWITSIVYLFIIGMAVVLGFLHKWGLMVVMTGVAVSMLHIFLLIVFKTRNKITRLFFIIGIFVIIGGLITQAGRFDYLTIYVIAMYLVVAFGVGVFCLYLAAKKRSQIREYSLTVEARCEIVDVKKINLFRFDDIISSPYNPMNDNILTKPAFHYFVNGQEYYIESEVYYGDMNGGFEEGAQITLRVNPNNPTEVLPRNVGTAIEMIMGISWIAIGIITIVALAVSYYFGIFEGTFL